MMQNDIDRILANDDEITPSSKFLESVMEAVEREAATPPALAFPWSRALPGILAALAAFAAALWNGIGSLSDSTSTAVFDEQVRQFAALALANGFQWIALAMAITVMSLMLSSSLMRARYRILT